MKKLKMLLVRIYHVKALKYALVTLIAVILIGFVDENSMWHHFQNKQKIRRSRNIRTSTNGIKNR